MIYQIQNYTYFILFYCACKQVNCHLKSYVRILCLLIHISMELWFALMQQMKHIIKCGRKDRFGVGDFQYIIRKRK